MIESFLDLTTLRSPLWCGTTVKSLHCTFIESYAQVTFKMPYNLVSFTYSLTGALKAVYKT